MLVKESEGFRSCGGDKGTFGDVSVGEGKTVTLEGSAICDDVFTALPSTCSSSSDSLHNTNSASRSGKFGDRPGEEEDVVEGRASWQGGISSSFKSIAPGLGFSFAFAGVEKLADIDLCSQVTGTVKTTGAVSNGHSSKRRERVFTFSSFVFNCSMVTVEGADGSSTSATTVTKPEPHLS
ncbi:unnamed protein product [Soboliphyme baturini]|uniref:Uncharacterized protein n=1 Tax=Soboliphyme baturini TaxID=241478 RepID=A0A183IA89_9BILA|nr:unnamed protein product [Soboliphyme baturini]